MSKIIRPPVDLPPDTTLELTGAALKQGQEIRSTTYNYQARHAEGFDDVTDIFSEENPGVGFLTNINYVCGGGEYDRIGVTYENIVSNEYPVARYHKSSTIVPLALEKHPDYKTWWNHHVIRKSSEAAQGSYNANTWKAVTDGTKGQDFEHYQWHKATAAVPNGFEIVTECNKPGQTSYLVPTVEVIETVLSATEELALYHEADIGTLGAPANTMGEAEDWEKWLVYGGKVGRKGPWYVTTNTYRFLPGGWDTDLYEYSV